MVVWVRIGKILPILFFLILCFLESHYHSHLFRLAYLVVVPPCFLCRNSCMVSLCVILNVQFYLYFFFIFLFAFLMLSKMCLYSFSDKCIFSSDTKGLYQCLIHGPMNSSQHSVMTWLRICQAPTRSRLLRKRQATYPMLCLSREK